MRTQLFKRGTDTIPRILTLHLQEGLLHRIAISEFGKDIILKGGLLFYQRQGFSARPTVVEAAVNTFRNRNTALPESPESFSENYWNSQVFKSDWMRFPKRIGATSPEYNTLKRNLPPLLRKIYEDLRARMNAS